MQEKKEKCVYCPCCGSKLCEVEKGNDLTLRCWKCKKLISVGWELKTSTNIKKVN